MSTRRVTLVAAAMLLLGAGLALYVRKALEPKYLGKTTEQWFCEFRAAEFRHLKTNTIKGLVLVRSPAGAWMALQGPTAVTAPSGQPLIWDTSVTGLRRDPAIEALCALGTNAIPYLIEQIRCEDSRWARAYMGFYPKLPPRLRAIAPRPPLPREVIRQDAALALSALGDKALPAMPALSESLKTAGLLSQRAILQTLRGLSFDPPQADPALDFLCRSNRLLEAMQIVSSLHLRSPGAARVLMGALASRDVSLRRSAVSELASYGQQAAPFVPTLAGALKDSDAEVRNGAARAFGGLQPRSPAALPALVEALKTGDDELRYLAARALADWGTNALPALPALLQATNDPSTMVQHASARAVRSARGESQE